MCVCDVVVWCLVCGVFCFMVCLCDVVWCSMLYCVLCDSYVVWCGVVGVVSGGVT